LSHIFNISLLHGKFPTLWKQVTVVPVSRKGNSALITNYRPITILNNFSIIFLSMISSPFILNLNFTHLSMLLLNLLQAIYLLT
jgi:hypothetical protein